MAAGSGHAFFHTGASSPARVHAHFLPGHPSAAACAMGACPTPAWPWLPEPPAADAVSARVALARGRLQPCSCSGSPVRMAASPGFTSAPSAATPSGDWGPGGC